MFSIGCWFHLSQNLWKHMQEYSLHIEYVKDKMIWRSYQRLKSLPFVPIKDVIKAFELIVKVIMSRMLIVCVHKFIYIIY